MTTAAALPGAPQVPGGGADGEERPAQIDRHRPVPELHGHVLEVRSLEDARRDDQAMQRSQTVDGGIDRPVQSPVFGNIGGDGKASAPRRFNGCHQLLLPRDCSDS